MMDISIAGRFWCVLRQSHGGLADLSGPDRVVDGGARVVASGRGQRWQQYGGSRNHGGT